MKPYIELAQKIMSNGTFKGDRTGTGTISIFAEQMKFDLQDGFPLMTTKEVDFKNVFEELMFFLRGETNIAHLVKKGVNIWNRDAYKHYLKVTEDSTEYQLSRKEFVNKIRTDGEFAEIHGELGRVYGAQWRGFRSRNNEVDQIVRLIELLKSNPDDRRMIVCAWNVAELDEMVLPCCHYAFETYVANGKLSLRYIMRSNDFFLGCPYNIASYALLTHLLAEHCGYEVGELTPSLGDVHIYQNHMEQIIEQTKRTPYPLPTLRIKNKRENIWDYEFEDIEIIGYKHHPKIKGEQSA